MYRLRPPRSGGRSARPAALRLFRNCGGLFVFSAGIAIVASQTGTASAQSISDMYFFGGSYTDAGTYLVEDPDGTIEVDGTYFEQRRWTINPGPVWNQLLGQAYRLDIESNLLIDTTSDVNDPITIDNGGTNYAQGGAAVLGSGNFQYNTLSVTDQVLSYLNSVGFAPDPAALYAVEGGGNTIIRELEDVDNGIISVPDALVHIEDSARLTGDLATGFLDLGARYVMVINTNDLGDVPGASKFDNLDKDTINQIVRAYNDAMLKSLSDTGKEYIFVDYYGLFKELSKNGALYGFDNTTEAACLSTITNAIDCTVDTLEAGIDPDTYLWDGGLHPSAAGHSAMSQYVQSILSAPGQYAYLAEVPLTMQRSTTRFVDGRLGFNADAADGLSIVFDGSGQWIDLAGSGPGQGAAGGAGNVLGGLEYRLDDRATVGVVGGYGSGNLDFPDGGGGFDLGLASVTAYAGTDIGRFFVNAAASYGRIDYSDIVRAYDLHQGQVLTYAGTRGRSVSAHASTGYRFALQHNSVLPFVSVAYQKVDVDGYTETGPDWTTMRFEDQQRTSLVGTLGLRFERTSKIAGQEVKVWFEPSYNYDFDAGPRAITAGLTAADGVMFTLPYDTATEQWFSFSGGIETTVNGVVDVALQGGLSATEGAVDNAWGGVSLSVPLY